MGSHRSIARAQRSQRSILWRAYRASQDRSRLVCWLKASWEDEIKRSRAGNRYLLNMHWVYAIYCLMTPEGQLWRARTLSHLYSLSERLGNSRVLQVTFYSDAKSRPFPRNRNKMISKRARQYQCEAQYSSSAGWPERMQLLPRRTTG